MKVSDIMCRDVTTIKLGTTLREAAQLMKQHDIGSLPVTDDDRIKGMLTDRDIVVRALADGKNPEEVRAADAMTQKIQYIFEDEDIAQAAERMKSQQIRRLVVLNRDKRLVGFVSLGDLARDADDERMTGDVTRRVSEPSGVTAH